MRHLRVAALEVALLARGVVRSSPLGALVGAAGAAKALAASLLGAAVEAVDVAAITSSTESYLTGASGTRVEAEGVDEAGRPPVDV
jgi:shikimate 5-dehydrogenase